MKNLWSEKEAKLFSKSDISLRVYSSRLLGQNPELVLHGGGNTSVKGKYKNIDAVVGIDSRGFIFGAPLALKLNCSFVLARKEGKLPFKSISAEYELEYGKDSIEMHIDAIKPEENVLIIDDLLATGGTSKAVIELVRKLNGKIFEISYLIELVDLNGSAQLGDVEKFSLVQF
jgi:adenine phosphoribosyltransferase